MIVSMIALADFSLSNDFHTESTAIKARLPEVGINIAFSSAESKQSLTFMTAVMSHLSAAN